MFSFIKKDKNIEFNVEEKIQEIKEFIHDITGPDGKVSTELYVQRIKEKKLGFHKIRELFSNENIKEDSSESFFSDVNKIHQEINNILSYDVLNTNLKIIKISNDGTEYTRGIFIDGDDLDPYFRRYCGETLYYFGPFGDGAKIHSIEKYIKILPKYKNLILSRIKQKYNSLPN